MPLIGNVADVGVSMPKGWMRQIIGQSDSLYKANLKAEQRPSRCIGHFFDTKARKFVKVDLGPVIARPVRSFRPASSVEPLWFDEPKNVLSWEVEGAGQNDEYLTCLNGFDLDRKDLARQSTINKSGFVVIPGQSLMGETNNG